jgi:hypothetical protein
MAQVDFCAVALGVVMNRRIRTPTSEHLRQHFHLSVQLLYLTEPADSPAVLIQQRLVARSVRQDAVAQAKASPGLLHKGPDILHARVCRIVLDGFAGVLVSDFYSAYDAPKCQQQKCLIHLIRDINDDLFHSPFDEELKQLAQGLVAVLKPIIDTIDRYGLKRYHLHKHKEAVERFFRPITENAYGSEAARKYQKRLLKYRDKLFVFLDHDGIPWNNNNAENALKRFASRRKIIGASFTEKGLGDYLVFLSIYQTCRHKNVSFLRFLRSGMLDLDAFAEPGRR